MPTSNHEETSVTRVIERVLPNGWRMSTHLVKLRDGGLLVVSPVKPEAGVFEAIDAFGPVRAIVAPNHFHHLSIPKYRARYPDALVAATTEATPRLARKGHAGLVELAALDGLLPEGAHWIRPAGAKNGEAWLSYLDDGKRTWLTTDAFFNCEEPVTGFTGFVMRQLQVIPGLQLSRTFKLVGIADRKTYREAVLDLIKREQPERLRVGHGAATSQDVSRRLEELVRARLA